VLKKPVLELQIGKFQFNWAPAEHTAGNQSVNNIDDAEAAIQYYLNGGSLSARAEQARQSYLRKFYYRVDGLASLRCAATIHREISAPRYTDEDQAYTAQLTEGARLQAHTDRDPRIMVRIKRALGIRRHRTLRPWKKVFWTAGSRINPKDLERLYGQYRYATNESPAQHELLSRGIR
jgi:hypothetical protein